MSCDKLENSHKNVPDEFKCGQCRKILNEACQIRCGCRFCRSCVDEMMNNGCQICPGITSDCKTELLSTVQLDYRANKQISQLIMKCPEEMCSYEKLIEHFQLENYNHNKTLIDIIDNIKNEVEMMKKEKLEMENRLKNVEMFNDEIRLGINQLKRFVDNKMKGIFEMMIDNIDYLRDNNSNYICSEYFYTRIDPYKLQLRIYLSDDKLWIYLYIYDDVINRYLSYPFKADVTIKVTNKNKRGKSKSITKYCQIEEPGNNSSNFNVSDRFVYQYSELTESGRLESNSCFIVECCVELRK